MRKDSPFVRDFILPSQKAVVVSIHNKEKEEVDIEIIASNEELLAVARQILSNAKEVSFQFSTSNELKYPNEILIQTHGLSHLPHGSLSQILVSLVYKLSTY